MHALPCYFFFLIKVIKWRQNKNIGVGLEEYLWSIKSQKHDKLIISSFSYVSFLNDLHIAVRVLIISHMKRF